MNELINYCFVGVEFGENTETDVFVTQEQVEALSTACSTVTENNFWASDGIVKDCCMIAKAEPSGESAVIIRRDILLAAG